MKTKIDTYIYEIFRVIANAYGIRGVTAMLSLWSKDQGGLEFVQTCVKHATIESTESYYVHKP